MKTKMVFMIGALALLSLSLVAFSAIEPVSAVFNGYRGGDPATVPTCTDDCDRTGVQDFGRGGMVSGSGRGRMGSIGAGAAREPLSESEVDGLILAIAEEYKARALYEYVIDQFGAESPFVEIAASEAKHAQVLLRQADKYGVTYPVYDPSIYEFPDFSNIDDAYQAGIDAELADAELYDMLFTFTTHSDLIRVYTNLKNASLENHLVAFQTYLGN
jgi:hypothetical protein